MAASDEQRPGQLTIQLEPELQHKVESAAAAAGLSVREYVVAALRRALAEREPGEEPDAAAWSRLSARSFARDWDSEEDRVYDSLR